MDVEETDIPARPLSRTEKLQFEIEELCQQSKNHEVSEQELQEHFLDFSSDELKNAVDSMIRAMKIQVGTDEQRHTFIRLRDPSIIRKLAGIEPDDVRVYEAVESVGSRGISTRYLHTKTKIANVKVTKILASLESKQLIKAVKLQKNSQHVKSYVLFHLKLDDPSNVHQTVFGSGPAFDAPLFDMVSKLCVVVFLKRRKAHGGEYAKTQATLEEILTDVAATGAVKADLTEESIAAVMKMLELSGKVEARIYPNEGGILRYRLHYVRSEKVDTTIPCVSCPVKHLCDINSSINPLECPHMDGWWRKVDF